MCAVVEGLPARSVVVVSPVYDEDGSDLLNLFLAVFLAHRADRGYPILILAPDWGLGASLDVIGRALETRGYVYGQDYLEWGQPNVPPETWIMTATISLDEACGGLDYYGRRLSDLPLARAVPSLTPSFVAAILVIEEPSVGGALEWYTYMAGEDIPMVSAGPKFFPGEIPPYLGTYTSYHLATLHQCAEYERLLGHPGEATKTQDVQSLLALAILSLPVLGKPRVCGVQAPSLFHTFGESS